MTRPDIEPGVAADYTLRSLYRSVLGRGFGYGPAGLRPLQAGSRSSACSALRRPDIHKSRDALPLGRSRPRTTPDL
jgi:hypothetical protein